MERLLVLRASTHGYPDETVIGNDHLYTFAARNIMHSNMAFWTRFPLTPEALPPQPMGKIYGTSTVFYDWYANSRALLYAKDSNVSLTHI
ncbi:hypothetical protein BG015_003285 [Linnemannia schmuckeri]|uniref:Uncharacterized protein n=1 Tax=Linnemannia schmuckeri TaxID=64567 RepID=A0A9P5VDF6_9FUNG|nr:hypothetical protein BG015_003285 [Linnemannia schmuckeri]